MSAKSEPVSFDTTLTSRYECKYLLDQRLATQIRRYLRPHARLDPFAAKSEDHRYRVHSLYFDSKDLHLYHDTVQGVRNRYKIRLRYYSEEGEGPVFLEVKKRANIIVRKNRERVTRREASELLETGSFRSEIDHGEDLGEFFKRCQESNAQPALRIRYWREAWASRGVDPVRITFDTDVEHCLLSCRGLSEPRPAWRQTRFEEPIILEIKFTDVRPHWVDEMVRRFQLDKISIAKYAESVDHAFDAGLGPVLNASMALDTRWSSGVGLRQHS